MEEAKHEFDGEPLKMAQTHETKPPKRPDKVPLDASARGSPPRYSSMLANNELRTGSNATDEAISRLDVSDGDRATDQDGNEESALRLQMEVLRKQLREANNRADQAERAAEELTRQIESRSSEVAVSSGDSAGLIQTLLAENKGLKAELDDARSHIFSLQPYRKDLTPEEVGQEFDDLVNNVTEWVTRFLEPILDDDDKMDEALMLAIKKASEVERLRKYMHGQGDLVNACMYPDTDIDIFIALVMRFLQDNIFQKTLIGAVPSAVEVLSYIEGSMQTNVEPKRDLFALRTWRAETMNAIICSPDYQRARAIRIKELTMELASLFRVFKKDKDWTKLCYSCQEEFIRPAVALHEKFVTSTHHFYLDLNPYMIWSGRQSLETSPDFLDDLVNLRCENILQNRKPFNVAKLDPQPTKEQLRRELANVVTVVPALYMRQVGKGDVIREPAVVRMQQVLVAWGPPEKRERFIMKGDRTLMHRLYHSQRARAERGQDGSGWTPWRGPWA
ncbi:hypothetical protein MMYC01_209753 [Madurella mycetomatis]|uniref:Uncharacterized protein n=1 Tax=Madurella mycetomatis TaxID=100816 RepID=A0A175VQS5_9PEZI|nr:hypothetical protein MMYC01_209753 [Madurella mycetomatis]